MMALVTILVMIVLVEASVFNYQLYKLIVLDAECRGLKHPKFWGIFSVSGNDGGGGLILYLLRRKKYPSYMTDNVKEIFNSRKRKIISALIFILIGTGCLFCIGLSGNI